MTLHAERFNPPECIPPKVSHVRELAPGLWAASIRVGEFRRQLISGRWIVYDKPNGKVIDVCTDREFGEKYDQIASS